MATTGAGALTYKHKLHQGGCGNNRRWNTDLLIQTKQRRMWQQQAQGVVSDTWITLLYSLYHKRKNILNCYLIGEGGEEGR